MLAWLQKTFCGCFPQPQPISHSDDQSAVSNAATPDGEQKDREHQPLLSRVKSYSEKSPRDVDGCYLFEGSEEGGGEFIDIDKKTPGLSSEDRKMLLKFGDPWSPSRCVTVSASTQLKLESTSAVNIKNSEGVENSMPTTKKIPEGDDNHGAANLFMKQIGAALSKPNQIVASCYRTTSDSPSSEESTDVVEAVVLVQYESTDVYSAFKKSEDIKKKCREGQYPNTKISLTLGVKGMISNFNFEYCLMEDVKELVKKRFVPEIIWFTIISFSRGPFIKDAHVSFVEDLEEEFLEGAHAVVDVYSGKLAESDLFPHEEEVKKDYTDAFLKYTSVAHIPYDCKKETRQLLILKNNATPERRRRRQRNERSFHVKNVYILIYTTKEEFLFDQNDEMSNDGSYIESENCLTNHYLFTIPSKKFEGLFLEPNKGKPMQEVGELAINFAQGLKDNVNTSMDPNVHKLFGEAKKEMEPMYNSAGSTMSVSSPMSPSTSSLTSEALLLAKDSSSIAKTLQLEYNDSAYELPGTPSCKIVSPAVTWN